MKETVLDRLCYVIKTLLHLTGTGFMVVGVFIFAAGGDLEWIGLTIVAWAFCYWLLGLIFKAVRWFFYGSINTSNLIDQ